MGNSAVVSGRCLSKIRTLPSPVARITRMRALDTFPEHSRENSERRSPVVIPGTARNLSFSHARQSQRKGIPPRPTPPAPSVFSPNPRAATSLFRRNDSRRRSGSHTRHCRQPITPKPSTHNHQPGNQRLPSYRCSMDAVWMKYG